LFFFVLQDVSVSILTRSRINGNSVAMW